MSARRWLVVGAGAAGCVVAATLGRSADTDVLLLEAGPDRTPSNRRPEVTSQDWSQVFGDSSLWWPGLTAARRAGGPAIPYLRGLGVGGSAAVNGLLAMPGLPTDWERWATVHGCHGWAWDDIADDIGRLRRRCWRPEGARRGSLDQALGRAVAELGMPTDIDPWEAGDGMGTAWLTATPDARHSSAEQWLDPARSRGEVRVLSGSHVERVVIEHERASGVRLYSGEIVRADGVVLCAGALSSPAILLRSGLDHRSLGGHLQDHPSIRVVLRRRDAVRQFMGAPIQSILRLSSTVGSGDIHVLPFDSGGSDVSLVVGLMATTSRGALHLSSDPLGHPVVQTGELSTSHDVTAMADARRSLERLVKCEALAASFEVTESVSDANDLFHAAGTCKMGAVGDPAAVVDVNGRVLGIDRLWVADASVFPELPSAGPLIPTILVAGRIARRAVTS